MIVYSSAQRRFVTDRLGFPAERVVLTPFTVDTTFFAPDRVSPTPNGAMICTAGLEFRDYATLVEAVRGLDARVVIAAASPWSKRSDATEGADLPSNVEVCRLGFVDLRELYADARFVVMPLHDVEFQAGVTTILEAMAMGKAVVCSRSQGQTDIIVDGSTGVYVAPRDPAAMRAALGELLADPARAEHMGALGRVYVTGECDVAVYAERLASVVNGVIARHSGSR